MIEVRRIAEQAPIAPAPEEATIWLSAVALRHWPRLSRSSRYSRPSLPAPAIRCGCAAEPASSPSSATPAEPTSRSRWLRAAKLNGAK